ncbi:MAG: hypothetical protein JWM99_2403, partial [Verrucomicrobiales bacterium]|nr:hypothetical protein [Verrucomicrobiales bacterium]
MRSGPGRNGGPNRCVILARIIGIGGQALSKRLISRAAGLVY